MINCDQLFFKIWIYAPLINLGGVTPNTKHLTTKLQGVEKLTETKQIVSNYHTYIISNSTWAARGWWLAAAGDVCDYHFVNDELMYGCIHGIDVKWIFCLIETYKILCGIIHHILSADKLRPAQIHFPAPAPALPATGQGWILCQYLQLFLL